MKIINRDLSPEKDGIPGYIAHPDRKEPGPGVLIVHHHFGVTGNMKVNVCNFAKLGYTTIVPDLYKMLGESDGVHEAQKKTTDGQFLEVLNKSWRYLTTRHGSRQQALRSGWILHGRAHRHPFCRRYPERSGFRRLLSISPRGRTESVKTTPPQ